MFATPPAAARARIAAVEVEDVLEGIEADEEQEAKELELQRLKEFAIYEPVDEETAKHCKKLSTK